MKIRKYCSKDFEDVRRICRETCSDENLLRHDTVLCTKYADYYTEAEPEHIWILADDSDRAQGYILCCPDWQHYRKSWKEEYLSRIRGNGIYYRLLQAHTMLEVKSMGKKGYPAHLHIDISPEFQRCGGGSGMMTALLSQLREEGVPGIYLGCGISNEVGNSFYRKYGFTLFESSLGRNVYVMDLKKD